MTPPRKVFTAGCFNRVHKAHVKALEAARALGDELVVVLSSDAHNKKPYAVPAATRLGWIQNLAIADKALVGKDDSFSKSLIEEKPDILALGYDQKIPDAETEKVILELGIQVARLPWFEGKEEIIFSVK